MKKITEDILKLIGNTPLLEVNLDIPKTKVLAKLEIYNLTGSVKDRMALYMLERAKRKSILKPKATIIEATSGNTGISFAALARIFGYQMLVVMPEGQSLERIKMLKSYQAKVILTPKKDGFLGAIKLRDKLAKKIPHAWVPDQFANQDNVKAHEKGITREIINQTKGHFTYFVHGIGTGGTFMGIANILKAKFPRIKIIAVEPSESAVLSGRKAGEHEIAGIGEGFIPPIVNLNLIDKVITVSTKEAIFEAKEIALKTGLLIGFSSGANIAAVKKLAREDKHDKTIITIFADRGERYLSIA